MLERQRIGICTLCAPYASRRHGSRTRSSLVNDCKERRKSGAGERTRTADLLITNERGPGLCATTMSVTLLSPMPLGSTIATWAGG